MKKSTIESGPRTMINVLGIPGILTVVWLGEWWFLSFVWIVVILGTIEFKKIAEYQGGQPSLVVMLLLVSIIIFNYKFNFISNEIIILLSLLTIFSIELFSNKKKALLNVSSTLFGTIWIGLMLGSMLAIREIDYMGFELLLLMFLSIWACDSAAFFFGKLFGKKKILPLVSPKKSWVGSISGLVAAIIVSYGLYSTETNFANYIDFGKINKVFNIGDILFLGIIFGGFSQLGDFGESLLKREAGIKDTSNILQGHGGILDRFDSISFSAPVYYIYLMYTLN